ncbi:protein zwilch homolog [Engraulis encrasicolus]|uniref:protein zwilch homolog n=1 Tax=Engraulis encrasicolus TaxID=184585 RepID=UPI002FCE85E6
MRTTKYLFFLHDNRFIWVTVRCTGTSATLGLLILQSYKQEIEEASLLSLVPVHMVLQMGLDKMRKNYINYLIELLPEHRDGPPRAGDTHKETAPPLEIAVICSTFPHLHHEGLLPFTQ